MKLKTNRCIKFNDSCRGEIGTHVLRYSRIYLVFPSRAVGVSGYLLARYARGGVWRTRRRKRRALYLYMCVFFLFFFKCVRGRLLPSVCVPITDRRFIAAASRRHTGQVVRSPVSERTAFSREKVSAHASRRRDSHFRDDRLRVSRIRSDVSTNETRNEVST